MDSIVCKEMQEENQRLRFRILSDIRYSIKNHNFIETALDENIKNIKKISYSKNAFDKYKNVENICLPVIMVDDRKIFKKNIENFQKKIQKFFRKKHRSFLEKNIENKNYGKEYVIGTTNEIKVVEEKNILEIKAIIKAGGTSEIIEECDYIIKNSKNDCENKIIKECSITSIGICLD